MAAAVNGQLKGHEEPEWRQPARVLTYHSGQLLRPTPFNRNNLPSQSIDTACHALRLPSLKMGSLVTVELKNLKNKIKKSKINN